MAQRIGTSIMIITDDLGNSWRVDRDAVMPVLEQHHMPLPPCPDGWSRRDYLYGAEEDCAVPVLLREASHWSSFAAVSPLIILLAHRQWRHFQKGQTHKPLYHAVNCTLAAFCCHALWLVSSAAGIDYAWNAVLVASFGILGVDSMVLTSTAFLNNAIDTMYALEPARGAVWRGRLVLTYDFLRSCYLVLQLGGTHTSVAHKTSTGIHVRRHMDDMLLSILAPALMFAITSAVMFLGAVGTARTARSLGASAETQQLRRRLRRQSRAATIHGALYSFISFGVLLMFFTAPRVFGICWSLFFAIVPGVTVCRVAMRKLRSSGHKRTERVVVAGHGVGRVAPERRISTVEDVAAAPAAIQISQVPLARRGVSLAFLRAFVKQKRIGARMSTADVCDRVIKPATADTLCAYYDLLHFDERDNGAFAAMPGTATAFATAPGRESASPREAEGSERWASGRSAAMPQQQQQQQKQKQQAREQWAGEASYFLSHSWSYRFRELVEILESFEEQTKPEQTVFYWFDIFVMNQHSAVHMDALFSNLQASVRSAGRLLLAVDSWREPAPLARVWCLLEIFTAISQKAELVLCFSRAEQASFAEKLVQNQVEVQRTLEAVDAEQAEATVAADREMIFALIQRGTGFCNFNDTIRLALRNSFERVVIAQRQLA